MRATRLAYGGFGWALTLGLLTHSGLLNAQTTEALLSGRITNALSGEPIASGHVTCTGAATNTVVTVMTNHEGFYTVPLLPPGEYELG